MPEFINPLRWLIDTEGLSLALTAALLVALFVATHRESLGSLSLTWLAIGAIQTAFIKLTLSFPFHTAPHIAHVYITAGQAAILLILACLVLFRGKRSWLQKWTEWSVLTLLAALSATLASGLNLERLWGRSNINFWYRLDDALWFADFVLLVIVVIIKFIHLHLDRMAAVRRLSGRKTSSKYVNQLGLRQPRA